MRTLFLGCIPFVISAQISSLTATTDGSEVYFVSRLRLRNVPEGHASRIYRIGNDGCLIAPAQRSADISEPGYLRVTISGTGTAVASTFLGSLPLAQPPNFAYIGEVLGGAGEAFRYFGVVQMSTNGRFAIGIPQGFAPNDNLTDRGPMPRRQDLSTGTGATFGPGIRSLRFSPRQAVANNGRIVVNQTILLGFPFSTFEVEFLPSIGSPFAPIISANGDTVVYEAVLNNRLAMLSVHIPTNKHTLMFVADNDGTPWLEPFIQDDGARVVALGREALNLPRQWLLLIPTDGGEARWLAYRPEGYREAILSGDGRVIWAVTEHNSLLRIDPENGATREMIPRSPWIASVIGAGQPGSRNRLIGGAFTDAVIVPAEYPAPTSLGGIQVELGGRLMPILRVSPTEIVYQIPWDMEAPRSRPIVRVPVESASPFSGPEALRPFPSPPEFEDPPGNHLDGKPITATNPIVPEETVDLHVTGFAVPGLITGVPAPESPEPISGTSCQILGFSGWRPLEVVRFRPAPGHAGLFELRVRFDRLISSWGEMIRCNYAGREAAMRFPLRPRQ